MVNHKGKSYTCVNVQKGGDHEGQGFSEMLRGVLVQEVTNGEERYLTKCNIHISKARGYSIL